MARTKEVNLTTFQFGGPTQTKVTTAVDVSFCVILPDCCYSCTKRILWMNFAIIFYQCLLKILQRTTLLKFDKLQ